jgi:transcriptional regulator with PAS, ATPase and Fis domain
VTPELLSPRIRQVEGVSWGGRASRGGRSSEMMDTVEKYFLIEALREHGNNKTNAAKALGITPRRNGCTRS